MNECELRLMNKNSVALMSYFPPYMIKRKLVDTSLGKPKKLALFLHYIHLVHLYSPTGYSTSS